MDYNLPRWLKKDIGLLHMSESDLNGLMFHPRHGGLCRRFIKFLAESTLCKQRYPTVYAQEELDEANRELDSKSRLLRSTIVELGNYIKEGENKQRELDFMADKLDYLRSIEELHRKTVERLEKIVNRPNHNLELIRESISTHSANYLTNNDLKGLYSCDLKELLQNHLKNISLTNKTADNGQPATATGGHLPLIKRQQSLQTENEYNDLIKKIGTMHQAVTIVLGEIIKKMSKLDYDQIELRTRPVLIEELLALKMPHCEEIIVEANSEEKELKQRNEKLFKQVNELELQVIDLANQYKLRREEITNQCKEELQRTKSIPVSLSSFS